MKIKDGLKLEPPEGQKLVEIPDCNRNDFAKFLFEEGYRTGVEVGVNQGEYGKTLAEAGLKMYGVDCWENYDGYKRVGTYFSHKEQAVEALKGLDYTIIHKYSVDAAKDFKDGSLDFVYIDSNHTLPYICQDIFAWHYKVRKGGIISGHDYANIRGFGEREDPKIYDGCHVKSGVNACVEVMQIPKLYVLGNRWTKNRDKWRTWFWINQ